MSTLEIRDLHVSVETETGAKEILRGVDLTVRAGETHAIMGPNGSGKSTLAYSLAGHPKYTVTSGTVTLDGEDVPGHDGRRAGPGRAVPGHAVPGRGPRRLGVQLPAHGQDRDRRRGAEAAHLGQGRQARHGRPGHRLRPSPSATSTRASPAARRSATRSCSSSCSTRESRSSTRPTPASTSTRCGSSSEGVNRFHARGGKGVLLITHYTRILRYIKPDFVHVFVDGRIAEEGGPELADKLEAEGYEQLRRHVGLTRHSGRNARGGATVYDLQGPLDVERVRKDFPILDRRLAGDRPLVYLDSAATSQKPRPVLDALADHYERHNANVPGASTARRGGHRRVRGRARHGRRVHRRADPRRGRLHQERLRGAQPRGQHAGQRSGRRRQVPPRPRRRGRHHRDGAPLQHRAVAAACQRTGATLRWFGLTDDGRLDLSDLDELVTERTKIVSFVHQSNILGTVNPVCADRGAGPRGRRAGTARLLPVGAAHCRSTSPRSAPTSSRSPGTRCAARPASACSGAAPSCSRRCRRSSAAAR